MGPGFPNGSRFFKRVLVFQMGPTFPNGSRFYESGSWFYQDRSCLSLEGPGFSKVGPGFLGPGFVGPRTQDLVLVVQIAE